MQKIYSVLRADTTLENQDQNLQFLAFLTIQTKAELPLEGIFLHSIFFPGNFH